MPSTASTSATAVPSFSATAARSPREIAGLVDQIDEIVADHAPRRIGDGERKLLAQPVRQRRLGGDEGFEIVVAVVAAAGADAAHSE